MSKVHFSLGTAPDTLIWFGIVRLLHFAVCCMPDGLAMTNEHSGGGAEIK